MNTNHSISTRGRRKIVVLGIALTIGVFLAVFFKENRPDENPKAKA